MDAPIRIIIVEDHDALREELVAFLQRPDWHVRGVDSGRALDAAWAELPADLLVLDLNLPGEDGLSIAERMRSVSDVGIIMLTARNAAGERAQGYGMGADIYLTKPANVGELESALFNLARRVRPQPLKLPVLSRARMELCLPDGSACSLSVTEYRLLAHLAAAPGLQSENAQLFEVLEPGHGPRGVLDNEARRRLTVAFSRLRRKLAAELDAPNIIKAVRGTGYQLGTRLSIDDP